MASQRNGNIKAFFKTEETQDKGKRPAASPPPAPAEKRQDTKCTTKPAKDIQTQPEHLSYQDLTSNWSSNQSPSSPKDSHKTLQLTYHHGDIFASCPPNTLLIHACNTQGHWGAGIAKAFKEHYPVAYKAHHIFCAKEHSKSYPVLAGTSQLLFPVDGEEGKGQWIGCVFTSAKYGKAKDKKDVILENTGAAMEMLLELVKMAGDVEVIRMCKINSGKFGVPWEETERVLKGIVVREYWLGTVEVWEP